MKSFIGVDWGTSNCRAYLFDGETVVDKMESDQGVLNVENFQSTIEDLLEKWSKVPVLFSGMVGSSIGWVEASYQRVPLPYNRILSSLMDIKSHWNREAYILGGLDYAPNALEYNVMRGEELQLLGLQEQIQEESLVVLLGTHSKHVRVNAREIHSFQTFLTGELFSLLQKYSIFAGPLEEHQIDFLSGVQKSKDGTLLSNLFSSRSLTLSHQISYPRAFLSGLLIGTELRTIPSEYVSNTVLVGSATLLPLYKACFEFLYESTPRCFVSDQCNIEGYVQSAKYLRWIS